MPKPPIPRIPLFALLLLSSAASAQQDTTTLQPVTVTATPIASPLPRIGRHLQVLDSAALHGIARPELSEILRMATLVDVRQRGPFDVQTDLSIRGGTYDQALVLVDGTPMADPQTGHHLMDLPIAVDATERVEVLYGGASRTFGAGAFSGAVNLITRPPTQTRGIFTLEAGDFEMINARVMQDVLLGKTGLRVAAMYGSSAGQVKNSDYGQEGAQFEVRHAFGAPVLRVQAGYLHKRFGAQDFYSSLYPDQQEITGTLYASADLRKTGGNWDWSVRGYGRRHADLFELFRESDDHYRFENGYFIRGDADTARFGPTAFYTFHNRHRTDVAGAQAQLKRHWKAGVTAIDIHARLEHIYSNVLGEPMADPLFAPGERDPFTRADQRRNVALTLDHRYEHGRWTLDGGALLNINSAFTPEWAPGVDAVYRWETGQSTYFSVGRAFRFPTWTDLYYNRGGAVGSLDLRPEHADQVELGQRMQLGTIPVKISLWRRQGRDLIDWVVLPGSTITQAANLTEVDLNGIEAEATFACGKGRGGAMYAYQWADQNTFDFRSLYVLDHLTHNAVAWWQQRIYKNLRAQVNLSWRKRMGSYVQAETGLAMAYPDPLRVDLRVDYDFGRITLFASAYNLLDADQVDRGNVQLPGRWVSGGVQVHWGSE